MMRRWFRSLSAQLLLWALLPVTFAFIGLAFTGVYTHQRDMREFVADRNLALARSIARMIEIGVSQGAIGMNGEGLASWVAYIAEGQSGLVSLIGVDGKIITSAQEGQGGELPSEIAAFISTHTQREGTFFVRDCHHEFVLVALALVKGTKWAVLVQEPVATILGPILRFSSWTPIIALSSGILSLLVLVLGYRTIVKPLLRLSRTAEQVSWGDYSAIAGSIGGVQEIRDLHRAMMGMVERIQKYQAGMRDYLGAVSQGQEVERSRLARELHDGPVQELIGLVQRMEMTRRLLSRNEPDRALLLLDELRRAGLMTVDELRRIIGALRPVYLDDLGFLPALEVLVDRMSKHASACIVLQVDGPVPRYQPEIELAAYRIVQETLRNAVQHAHAAQITLLVRNEARGLMLAVHDDGIGFVFPPAPDVLTRAGHFGLVGVQERVARLGGTLHIQTDSGKGTQVTVHLPPRMAAG